MISRECYCYFDSITTFAIRFHVWRYRIIPSYSVLGQISFRLFRMFSPKTEGELHSENTIPVFLFSKSNNVWISLSVLDAELDQRIVLKMCTVVDLYNNGHKCIMYRYKCINNEQIVPETKVRDKLHKNLGEIVL